MQGTSLRVLEENIEAAKNEVKALEVQIGLEVGQEKKAVLENQWVEATLEVMNRQRLLQFRLDEILGEMLKSQRSNVSI